MEDNFKILKTIELSSLTVVLRSDGIIQYILKKGKILNIQDAKAILRAVETLGEKKKFPLLFTLGVASTVNTEARFYAATEEANQYTLALAIVVNNSAQTFLGNTYIKFNKPLKPTKLFTSEEEAIKWLDKFR